MPMVPLHGHAEVRARLLRTAAAGALPQSLLLHGPAGVGKERLALWLAQALLCANPGPEGEGCGVCASCRAVQRLEHPDLHWFFPLPRPDASSPEKLREKLEEGRFAELEARRRNPLHLPEFDKAPAWFLGMVQNLSRLASLRPSSGSRKVFVVADAELMVPQESSPEAANAFLKLLEEPPADTTLLLTSSNPGALLDTIRSRVLPVRLLPLAVDQVAAFLQREKGMAAAEAAQLAAISQGAIGRALRLAPGSGGAGALRKERDRARALLVAATAPSAAARMALANGTAPAGARGEFSAVLEALGQWLRDLLAVASGAGDAVAYSDDAELLASLARRPGLAPPGVASAITRVRDAQLLAAGNVNPQLIVADLLRGMRADLGGEG